MKITREELREKIWYRLVKVFYIIASIIALYMGLATYASSESPVAFLDREKSTFTCTDGERIGQTGSLESIDVYSFGLFLTDEERKKIYFYCNNELDKSAFNVARYIPVAERENRFDGGTLDYTENNEINYVYWYSISTFGYLLGLFIVAVLIILGIVLVKNMFFYVVTGQFWQLGYRKIEKLTFQKMKRFLKSLLS